MLISMYQRKVFSGYLIGITTTLAKKMNIDVAFFRAALLSDVIIMFAEWELASGGGLELTSPLMWFW